VGDSEVGKGGADRLYMTKDRERIMAQACAGTGSSQRTLNNKKLINLVVVWNYIYGNSGVVLCK
jgi:hypothetical protein